MSIDGPVKKDKEDMMKVSKTNGVDSAGQTG
jgi:hypothetical protein